MSCIHPHQSPCPSLPANPPPSHRVCFTQLDAAVMERGLVCEPGSVPALSSVVCAVERIRFFKGAIPTKGRFHVTLGHATVMARAVFFKGPAVGAQQQPKGAGAGAGAGAAATAAAAAELAVSKWKRQSTAPLLDA